MPAALHEQMLAAFGRFHAALAVLLVVLALPWLLLRRRSSISPARRRFAAWGLLLAVGAAAFLPVASTLEIRRIDRAMGAVPSMTIDFDRVDEEAHRIADAIASPWRPLFAGACGKGVVVEPDGVSVVMRPHNWARVIVLALVVAATGVGLWRWRSATGAPRGYAAAAAATTLIVAASFVWWNEELHRRASIGEFVDAVQRSVETRSR